MPVTQDARSGGANVTVRRTEDPFEQVRFNDIDGLIEPKRLKTAEVSGLEFCPAVEFGLDRGATLGENAAGSLLVEGIGRKKLAE